METNRRDAAGTFRFSVGTVLGRTFSTLFRGFGVFFSLSFITALMAGGIGYLWSYTRVGIFLRPPIGLILGLLMQGAVAFGVFQILTGGAASLGDSLSHGLERIFSLIGASLPINLCIGLCSFIPIALMGVGINFIINGMAGTRELRRDEDVLFLIALLIIMVVLELLIAVLLCMGRRPSGLRRGASGPYRERKAQRTADLRVPPENLRPRPADVYHHLDPRVDYIVRHGRPYPFRRFLRSGHGRGSYFFPGIRQRDDRRHLLQPEDGQGGHLHRKPGERLRSN
jgi:hypothetical protein